ncbi:MAG: M1 family metallopeptidase [Planctomycetaceae bacterium]
MRLPRLLAGWSSISACCVLFFVLSSTNLMAQGLTNSKYGQEDKFRQLEEILPTANDYRAASGAPGHRYWQQKVDYDIAVELDDAKQKIVGRETITYLNNSPDTLSYLWLQLDANIFAPHANSTLSDEAPPMFNGGVPLRSLEAMLTRDDFEGQTQIKEVTNAEDGSKLSYSIVRTNMRVDLPTPLAPGQSVRFVVGWEYNINNTRLFPGRTGYEYFEEDKNYIYEMAQWFPRLCAYTDTTGWQHKEYIGQGEFTLEFGDYVVRITVPDDHIVASTGELQNPAEVLTETQRQRLEHARTAASPAFIVTPEEAMENQKAGSEGRKTWIFKADNVRDFAFASSRKFIWDALGHDVGGNKVLAMSFYPNEGEPLWSKYSTRAIVHTLNVYSKYTFNYPYPVAISVNGPVGGMEYPMICFNGPRPEKDGTYSDRTKFALITVIIHEVGHNYFPMIVNTDERQWTWMDEGLNTFLQYLSEVEWEETYPADRGEPKNIVGYMKSTEQVPIMVNSESLLQFGNNAYAKPATALNILRETVLGRELFDFAFKEYARRWKFKRPYPADFFRTMEDASGVDLDWFWRGWFYTTDHCDIEITGVQHFTVSDGDPEREAQEKRAARDAEPKTLSQQRNKALPKLVDQFPELKDFYNSFDEFQVSDEDKKAFERRVAAMSEKDRELLKTKMNFYVVDLKNIGGLVMPVILLLTHDDGTTTEVRLPAELWVKDSAAVSKMLMSEKPVTSIELDPHLETADTDRSNNYFPPKMTTSRFKTFSGGRMQQRERNAMQRAGLGKKEAKEPTQEKKPEGEGN